MVGSIAAWNTSRPRHYGPPPRMIFSKNSEMDSPEIWWMDMSKWERGKVKDRDLEIFGGIHVELSVYSTYGLSMYMWDSITKVGVWILGKVGR